MACSAVALSVATVSAVVALTCTAIAFGTDNWYEVRVNPDGNERLASLQEFESDLRYYSRDEGIFRICFPDKRPKGGKLIIEHFFPIFKNVLENIANFLHIQIKILMVTVK